MKRTPLKRRTPLRPVNHRRRRLLFDRNYGERGAIVRAMPCLLASSGSCFGVIHAAHVKARGMGGHGGDRRQLVPLCGHHHLLQSTLGAKTFGERMRIDLSIWAEHIAAELDRRGVA